MMKFENIFVCLFILCMGYMPYSNAHDNRPEFTDLVKKITPSIVAIATDSPLRGPRIIMRGTGFVVHDGLHIITNAHVVPKQEDLKYNEKIMVLIGRGMKADSRVAEIVYIDKEHDLALLKVNGNKIPKLTLGTGGLAEEGTDISVTGFPIGSVLGLYPVTHRGIISAVTPIVIPQPSATYLDPKIIEQTHYDVYQLDLTAFPGNSGSPVYNIVSGKVEGILNSVSVKNTKENALTNPTGISFAIPVIHLHNMLRKAGL